ncbi:MAG: site-specific integrase [Clostridia bacterium]|nr:site-specific integrase [Clostridia bacterium]
MRGTVTKKNNRWYIVYYIGKDANGKWKQKWEGGFDTKKEAEKALRARLDELENQFVRNVDTSTVTAYLLHWLDAYCVPRLATNTVIGYRVNIEKHIIPRIGKIKLSDLQPKDVQYLYDDLAQSGLSGTSVRYVHNTLHRALVSAVKSQIIPRNAADFVEPPVKSKFEVEPLMPEEARRLISACEETEIYMPVLLALVLGLRRGEVLALQWDDVDFDNRTVSIRRSANLIKGQFVISDTKTKNSRRTLRISDTMWNCLNEHKMKQRQFSEAFGEGFNPYNLVNCREDGTPFTPYAIQYRFKEILSKYNLPDIRFHDLRHTNATLLLRAEQPAKIVSAMLGHSCIGITLDIYSHVMTDMQSGAVKALESILNNPC